MLEENLEKNVPEIDFGTMLGSQNPSKIHPKSKKVPSKIESEKRLQRLNARGARLNGVHPASQAQEASQKSSI